MARARILGMVVVLAACTIEPLDGAHGVVGLDGTPDVFPMRGYAVGPNHIVRVQTRNRMNGTFMDATFADPADELSYETALAPGLFEWAIDLDITFLWDLAVVGETVLLELLVSETHPNAPDTLYPTHSFDESGMTCLFDRVNGGDDPGQAGNDCATGTTITNTFEVPRGETLMVDNVAARVCEPQMTYAFPYEDNHLLATRLSPPTYPYQLEEILYWAVEDPGNDPPCEASMRHEVLVFLSAPGDPPAEDPALVAQIPSEGGVTPDPVAYAMSVKLDTPVVVEEGQEVYVAIRMPTPGDATLCTVLCLSDDSVQPGRHWWSNAVDPPYPWTELSTFEIFSIPQIRLVGRAL